MPVSKNLIVSKVKAQGGHRVFVSHGDRPVVRFEIGSHSTELRAVLEAKANLEHALAQILSVEMTLRMRGLRSAS